jgi:hypothetical protein
VASAALRLARGAASLLKKLATYIPTHFEKPDFIFAAADSDESHRPRETVEPLHQKTGVHIHDKIANKSYEELAKKLLTDVGFSNQHGVVCWHHGEIPNLTHALGAEAGEYPAKWKDEVFNLILKLKYHADRKPTVTMILEPF